MLASFRKILEFAILEPNTTFVFDRVITEINE